MKQMLRGRRICLAKLAFVALLGTCGILLQGCALPALSSHSCRIDDIYGLVLVNGQDGHTKEELLSKFGVRLCARHLHRPWTYEDGGCPPPEDVFKDGTLPAWSSADPLAMLLLWCPQKAPQFSELQRVTCSYEPWYANTLLTGMQKQLKVRFDNAGAPQDCLSAVPSKKPGETHRSAHNDLLREEGTRSLEVTPQGSIRHEHPEAKWEELAASVLG
mmetsp:Transcript_49484/g.115738  ORF Transcript_49484/g.115738 Transcript_49484/m.115738 type:complete len:217 (+) Transcript_49484:77-727(+)